MTPHTHLDDYEEPRVDTTLADGNDKHAPVDVRSLHSARRRCTDPSYHPNVRIILAGAAGSAGRALLPLLAHVGKIIGLDRPGADPVEGCDWISVDIRDWRSLRELLGWTPRHVFEQRPTSKTGPLSRSRLSLHSDDR